MRNLITVTVFAVIFFGLLIGCTSTSSASYRLAGSTDAAWQVQGVWNQASGEVTITIDGTEVIKGQPGIFSSTKTLSGTYKDHKVAAILTKSTSFLDSEKMHCIITIDNEVAATFDW